MKKDDKEKPNMPLKTYYIKSPEKKTNVIEKHIVEKYGSMKNWQNSQEKRKDKNAENWGVIKNWELIIGRENFLKEMRAGAKVCTALRINYTELFMNENICSLITGKTEGLEENALIKYLTLDLAKKEQTIKFINNILSN
jgi:hypothetical protein